jgi:hypothetical protein
MRDVNSKYFINRPNRVIYVTPFSVVLFLIPFTNSQYSITGVAFWYIGTLLLSFPLSTLK